MRNRQCTSDAIHEGGSLHEDQEDRTGNIGGGVTWPFPPFPNPKDKGIKQPKFNPDNHEDAPR